MSSDVYLKSREFVDLRFGCERVSEWLERWDLALAARDGDGLMTLLHWGLQLRLERQISPEVARLFVRYLRVADSHSAFEKPNFQPAFQLRGRGDLSIKAWTELCNRVFVCENDEHGVEQLKFRYVFMEPELVKVFLEFLDPTRGIKMNLRQNVQQNVDCAYHKKALYFVRKFLKFAWSYHKWDKSIYKFFENITPETEQIRQERLKFFREIRPQLVELMHYYGILDFLHDQQLDSKSRRTLHKIAISGRSVNHPSIGDRQCNLAEEYGKLRVLENCCMPRHANREALRILLLYPALVLGRRAAVKERVAKRLAEIQKEKDALVIQISDAKSRLKSL